jgi:hypothetical protein
VPGRRGSLADGAGAREPRHARARDERHGTITVIGRRSRPGRRTASRRAASSRCCAHRCRHGTGFRRDAPAHFEPFFTTKEDGIGSARLPTVMGRRAERRRCRGAFGTTVTFTAYLPVHGPDERQLAGRRSRPRGPRDRARSAGRGRGAGSRAVRRVLEGVRERCRRLAE